MATKKIRPKKCWIRDPGWKKPGSGINIQDPQHCHLNLNERVFSLFFRYAVIIMEYVGSRNLHRLLIETPDKFLGTYPLIILLSKLKDIFGYF
jgi:hypothetical protein